MPYTILETAKGILAETLHGKPPMETIVKLAQAVIELTGEIGRVKKDWCSPRNAHELNLWRCKCGDWSAQGHICGRCGKDSSEEPS